FCWHLSSGRMTRATISNAHFARGVCTFQQTIHNLVTHGDGNGPRSRGEAAPNRCWRPPFRAAELVDLGRFAYSGEPGRLPFPKDETDQSLPASFPRATRRQAARGRPFFPPRRSPTWLRRVR